MAFRVKDLLINLAPGEGLEPDDGVQWLMTCKWSTTTHPTTLFVAPWLPCPGPTVIGPVGAAPTGDPAALHEQLELIRARLRRVLAEVEGWEPGGRGSEPQTLPEIEELQAKLQEALIELDRRKEELKKQK
ncbi:MAG TPA: hypothetical protein VFE35_07410 [Candidatus Cybelea sp.]|jgi:hypothetical protein|nr:hypothetical protein [Candidatus Cybelea sp.]